MKTFGVQDASCPQNSHSEARSCYDLHNPVSWWIAIGLALLYSSGYFYPRSQSSFAYYIISVWDGLILPTLVAVVLVASLGRFFGGLLNNHKKNSFVPGVTRLGLAILLLIGLRGVAFSAGYSLDTLVNILSGVFSSRLTHWRFKIVILFLLFSIIYVALRFLTWPGGVRRLTRFLAAMGYALFCVAILNISQFQSLDHVDASFEGLPNDFMSPLGDRVVEAGSLKRRVVWVIFDELDYRLVLGDQVQQSPHKLKNFQLLEEKGISAKKAYSPADFTSISIPSVLMGVQSVGEPKYLGPANYQLIEASGKSIPFTQLNTIFSRLPTENNKFSILGFHHPYCSIFKNASQCYGQGVTFERLYSGIIDWVPWPLLRPLIDDPWFSIYLEQHNRFLSFVGRSGDAISFFHLLAPHLPSQYASAHYDLPVSSNLKEQYAVNLRLADEILGQIIDELEKISGRQEVLLIVSSDHGLRMLKNTPDESRPVPWFAWRVGTHDRHHIEQPISTVHTAALIEDFLNNKVSSQNDILEWWRDKLVLPRLMVLPKNNYD